MKQTHALERDAAQNQVTRASAPEDYALNLTVVYHDARTQAWAREGVRPRDKIGGQGNGSTPRGGKSATWSSRECSRVRCPRQCEQSRSWWQLMPGRACLSPSTCGLTTGCPTGTSPRAAYWRCSGSFGPSNGHSSRVREYLREVARMASVPAGGTPTAGATDYAIRSPRSALTAAPAPGRSAHPGWRWSWCSTSGFLGLDPVGNGGPARDVGGGRRHAQGLIEALEIGLHGAQAIALAPHSSSTKAFSAPRSWKPDGVEQLVGRRAEVALSGFSTDPDSRGGDVCEPRNPAAST